MFCVRSMARIEAFQVSALGWVSGFKPSSNVIARVLAEAWRHSSRAKRAVAMQ